MPGISRRLREVLKRHSETLLRSKASSDREKVIMNFKQPDPKAYVVVVCIGIILATPQFSGQDTKTKPPKGESAACAIAISSPLPGAGVGAEGTVSGTAKIPDRK